MTPVQTHASICAAMRTAGKVPLLWQNVRHISPKWTAWRPSKVSTPRHHWRELDHTCAHETCYTQCIQSLVHPNVLNSVHLSARHSVLLTARMEAVGRTLTNHITDYSKGDQSFASGSPTWERTQDGYMSDGDFSRWKPSSMTACFMPLSHYKDPKRIVRDKCGQLISIERMHISFALMHIHRADNNQKRCTQSQKSLNAKTNVLATGIDVGDYVPIRTHKNEAINCRWYGEDPRRPYRQSAIVCSP